ncbi:MAG TPA: hypothetical protein PKI11_04655 [Candidatus Hydrogenedentes bacterium]|nr:hypothetical protein [Candidatus Hydrogenedentota bacterium]
MSPADGKDDHLTDYERAICYYALPRVVSPITLGIIVAYAVCVVEALAALAYGLIAGHPAWVEGGAWALAGIMVLGIVVFMGRALLNEVRQRRLLAAARGVPDALDEIHGLPDPFAGRVLLKHPRSARGVLLECHESENVTRYTLECEAGGRAWEIKTPDGAPVCRVVKLSGPPSFMLSVGIPRRLRVHRGDAVIADIVQRFSFSAPVVEIHCQDQPGRVYRIRGQSVFDGDSLAGRIYELRGSVYLDVRRDALHDGLLAFFATLG